VSQKQENMKKILLLLIVLLGFNSYSQDKTSYDKVALEEYFVSENGDFVQFKDILAKHKDKTIFIDIWASWCSDCLGSIPELKKLQQKEKDVVYVMLSLDKTKDLWRKGIKKYNLKADHYLFTKKWKKSPFCESIKLDWIPRYMIVGKDGTIKLYKAIEFKDENIIKKIKSDNDIYDSEGF